MPNHFHGILVINGGGVEECGCTAKCGGTVTCRGTARRAPTGNADDAVVHADGVRQFGRPIAGTLPTIIGAFKAAVTKRVNRLHQSTGTSVWQRNYYERVVRDEAELMRLREYIHNNPARWAQDSLRVDRSGHGEM
jgi:putative transposase